MAETCDKEMKEYFLISGYCRFESGDMNIVDGILSIIVEYQKQYAKWSNTYKGDNIKLLEDDCKAVSVANEDIGHSVRADFGIERGQIVSWELEIFQTNVSAYFFGVVSSKESNFNGCPYNEVVKDAYGIDDEMFFIYLGNGRVSMKSQGADFYDTWNESSLDYKTPQLKMIADWTQKQCKLSIFYQERRITFQKSIDEYTILLPELDDEYVWYPCATPYNKNAYCVIRYC